jgi:hypothetical protein
MKLFSHNKVVLPTGVSSQNVTIIVRNRLQEKWREVWREWDDNIKMELKQIEL